MNRSYRFWRGVAVFLERHTGLILLACLALTAVGVVGASRVSSKTDNSTFVSPSSQRFKDAERFGRIFGGDAIFVVISGKSSDLLSDKAIAQMTAIQRELRQQADISQVFGVIDLLGPAGHSSARTQVFKSDGTVRPQFKRVVPDAKHTLVIARLKPNLNNETLKDTLDQSESIVRRSKLAPLNTLVTGSPAIRTAINDEMQSSLRWMLLLSVVLMVVVLAVVFQARRRLLALPIVLIAVVWTFGAMGFMSISLTMVTMAIMPILIGLGVDYAIQFHNRYEEEIRRGDTASEAVIDALTHISPAVLTAVIATALGFAVLLTSTVPMVQNFGAVLAIGVFLCFLASLFLLNSILYRKDRNRTRDELPSGGHEREAVPRALGSLTRFVNAHPVPVISLAVGLSALGWMVEGGLKVETDMEKLMPQNIKALQDLNKVRDLLGGARTVNVVVTGKDVLTPETLRWMRRFERDARKRNPILRSQQSIADALAPANRGSLPSNEAQARKLVRKLPTTVRQRLISSDLRVANISFGATGQDAGKLRDTVKSLESLSLSVPDGLDAKPVGETVLFSKSLEEMSSGRHKLTFLGLIAIFVGLLVIYRRPGRAALPLLPIILVVGWSALVMRLLGIPYNPLTVTLGAMILGIGTEFTVLLQARYLEERSRGVSPSEAIVIASSRIGRAISASALTVAAGFGALIASDFIILRDFGTVILIDVLLALFATLFIMPPIITRIDRLLVRRASDHSHSQAEGKPT